MKTIRFIVCCSLLAAAPAAAQTNPPISEKYDVATRDVKIHDSMPIFCDSPTVAAANTINAANANIRLTNTGNIFGPEWINDNYREDQYINIVPATMNGYGASATTATTIRYSEAPYWAWETYGQILDSNIYVNHDLLYYGSGTDTQQTYDLFCSESFQGTIGQKADYQSVMLHEMGHALGFRHRTDGTTGPCVMAEYLARGTFKRAFCADETAKLREVYGTR
jgi:hypothetical protein